MRFLVLKVLSTSQTYSGFRSMAILLFTTGIIIMILSKVKGKSAYMPSSPSGWHLTQVSIAWSDQESYSTWIERSTVRVKCHAQERITMSPASAWTWTTGSRINTLTIRLLKKLVFLPLELCLAQLICLFCALQTSECIFTLIDAQPKC